ncbi:acyltransferase [Labedella phragmitis]|uniref:Acyltransferase n=1 Tax=Labedella phragmitis TaxID=2498849 RepID=A0A3S3Z7S6_9MICO|nr:acyltransferase [Labedella phragmitis]RWZ49578.1 acyltransferase [Labedella phragmitis]
MTPPTSSARIRSLDGLRGWAALIVLISHVMLTIPVFAEVVYNEVSPSDLSPVEYVLSYTPAHLLWAGHEAVFLFFVLSGIVLTMPALRFRDRSAWMRYYPRRIVRLYGPVVAAVLFGVLLVLLVPRVGAEGLGPWIDDRPATLTPTGVARDLLLVFGVSGVISPLWSLRWEVLFSLLLPLYVWAAVKWRKFAWAKLGLLTALMIGGVLIDSGYVFYLAMFAFGALAAVHLEDLRTAAARINNITWVLVLGVGVLLTTARWTLEPLVRSEALTVLPAFFGCAVLVFVAAFWPPAMRPLEHPVSQWLGKVSFSLYLTHEPIVIATTFIFGRQVPPLVPAISIAVSLAAAWLFFRWIEAPTHSLSRRIGAKSRLGASSA